MRIIVLILLLSILVLPITVLAAPITKHAAIQRSFETHPTVQAAMAVILAARGERLSSLSPASPKLISEYAGIPRQSNFKQFSEQKITLSQELNFPLKSYWTAKAANSGVNASKQQALGMLLDLESEIRTVFSDAWALDEKVKILHEDAEALNVYQNQVTKKVAVGESAPLESRRARVAYLQAKALLDATVAERNASFAKLCRMTGLDSTSLQLASPLDSSSLANHSILSANSHNTELSAASFEMQRSAALLARSRTNWLPDFEFAYFQQKIPNDEIVHTWGVEAGLSLPLWYWLGGRGELQTALANQKTASADYRKLQIEVASERDRLEKLLSSLRDKYDLYRTEIVPTASETYNLSLTSYRVGEANYLQVIDAQQSKLSAQLELIEIAREHELSLSELNRLEGISLIGLNELQNRLHKGK